jgi:polyphenol oxidase
MFKIFENTNLKYAFSDISDGNMAFKYGEKEEVIENRKRFLEKNGIPADKCVGTTLVHDSQILVASQMDASQYAVKTKEGDALITNEKDLFLFMSVADCLPIIIFDPVKEALALVHCGWKSTEEKLIQKVILKMVSEYGSRAENILVAIGPGIHKESYKKADHAVKTLKGWEPFIINLPDGDTAVDLVGYNVFQLKQSGILSENIEISPVDTAKDKNYFSHYRSVCTGKPEGRFCTVAGMQ